jgi:hypothetical protein
MLADCITPLLTPGKHVHQVHLLGCMILRVVKGGTDETTGKGGGRWQDSCIVAEHVLVAALFLDHMVYIKH